MDDNRLEELLQEAKSQADRFFAGWDLGPSRQKAKSRIQAGDFKKSFSLLARREWAKLGLALVFLLLTLFFPYRIRQAKQYALQTVTLDERRPSQLVNFVPVTNPAHTGQCLLAVLWGLNPQGQYQVIYSSMFNDSVLPHPVSTLDFPGTPYRMALLSSEDSEQKYLHYRLIGYADQNINTIFAADYVPGGKLDLEEGKMVEEREDGSVTHIIPYQIDDKGDLILSADKIQLQLGEKLLLIGFDLSNQINFIAREEAIRKIDEENEADKPKARFAASNVGEDYIRLTPNYNPAKGKTLYIRVVQ